MDTIAFPTLTEADRQLPVYLTIVGHWDNQEPIDRKQGYPDYQWLQCASGEGELRIGDRTVRVKAGQGIFLYPGVPHQYYTVEPPWDIHFISFNGALTETLVRQAGITESGVYTAHDGDLLVSHIKSAYALAQSERSFLALECSKLVYMFLLDLIKVVQVSPQSGEQTISKLQPVIRYVESRIDRPITIRELADRIDVTPQYLCLLFKKTMKMRPMEYVNRERINRSKEIMFLESDVRMSEVAKRVGFDSASYFSSVFRRIEGLSPEQFKKMHGMR
ncbi:AraC family transcriptional regulator [Paenibacillus thailandensis]|uniref:AraC family transcriptional regulator n=1 Tax=Paenibacillus thailandensis TaxID=393250 RepID=A0ABW5R2D3_9BACL